MPPSVRESLLATAGRLIAEAGVSGGWQNGSREGTKLGRYGVKGQQGDWRRGKIHHGDLH